jgi:hypothetical protein
MVQNSTPHPAYLFGSYSFTGWWYYFPLAFLVKSPLAFIAVTGMSAFWLCGSVFVRRRPDGVFLLAPLVVYGAFAMMSNVNIGLRHLLPVYPFLFVAAAGLWGALWERRSVIRWVAAGLGAWMTLSSLSIRCDPVEYFNELAGGPGGGWRYLSESNLDVGQNFLRLADWIRTRKPQALYMNLIGVEMNALPEDRLSLFLPYDLAAETIRQLPYSYREESGPMQPGQYAISVCRMLDPYLLKPGYRESDMAQAMPLRRFLGIRPDAKVGHTVWIYNLTEQDIERLGLSGIRLVYFKDLKYRTSQ